MKYFVKINAIKALDELEGAWSNADFTELLNRFGYDEAGKLNPSELKDYLFMAIADVEPSDAAALVLGYKLSEVLTEGQIDNLSHEMLREKVSENYSDIFIHKTLFSINQLLYKAYNGKFPKAKANTVEFELREEQNEGMDLTKELVLKALIPNLVDSNLINRLFKEQLEGDAPFPEAEGIIWNLEHKGNFQYSITTSEKWLSKDDFVNMEYECKVIPVIRKSEEE